MSRNRRRLMRRWIRRADRGSTTLEQVLHIGLWMLGLMLGVQIVVCCLAELECYYAANHGLQVARVQGGTADAGSADAAGIVAVINGRLVNGLQVHADRTADTATVTVRGTAAGVLPFFTLPVSVTATGPVEALNP